MAALVGVIMVYFLFCRTKEPTVNVKTLEEKKDVDAVDVEMSPVSGQTPGHKPPPGAIYMKNGVWLDKNDQPCQGAYQGAR